MRIKINKEFFKTLLFLVFVFLVTILPLLLSFILKKINPAEYGLIQGNKNDMEVTYKEILFYATVVCVLFFLSLSFRYVRQRWLKIILVAFAGTYLLCGGLIILADVVYYIIFSYRLTFSAVQTVLNTNPDEAGDFTRLYISSGNVIAVILFLISVAIVVYKRKWFRQFLSTPVFFFTSMVFTVAGIADFAQIAYSKSNGPHNVRYWDIIIGEYNEYNEFNRRLKAEINNQSISAEYNNYYSKDSSQKILVFVISESLSKRHMSLYGYRRKTTPNLDTNPNLYKFNNAVTQAALTIQAVPGLFFNGYFKKKINLITLLNKLNYNTCWISNQSGWGKGDASIVLLSQLCKKRMFMDEHSDDNKSNSSQHYDEAVLKQFDETLKSTKSSSEFIILHLMGCHFDYEKRYPALQAKFNGEAPAKTAVSGQRVNNIINTYDNAMHYHDSVVNKVIQLFTKHTVNKNAALVFISDHGEELFENRNYCGHGFPPTRVMAEIPFFALISPEFKKNYPQIEANMVSKLNTPYSTTNNFYTMLHLLNIHSPVHDAKINRNAFFSFRYNSTQPRLVMGIDYETMNP